MNSRAHVRTAGWGISVAVAAAMVFADPTPADAQAVAISPDATRHVYTFLQDRLEVRVVGVPAGSVRLLRGAPGELEVVGRAPNGIAGSGLERDGTERLNLGAVGADEAVFLVVVPAHVRVRVELPGEAPRRSFDPPSATTDFEWGRAEPSPLDEDPAEG